MAELAEPSLARTKEELVKAFRRTEILDAARRVIGEQGMHEISMDRIAREAGVAKGTLYLYFQNKDALVESALEYAFQEFTLRCRQAAEGASGYTRKLQAVAEAIVASNAENRAFGRALQERPDLGPEGRSALSERLRAQVEPFVDFVADLLEDGMRAGALKPVGGRRAALLFLSLMRGLTMQQLRDLDPADTGAELEVLLEVFLHGVAPEAKP